MSDQIKQLISKPQLQGQIYAASSGMKRLNTHLSSILDWIRKSDSHRLNIQKNPQKWPPLKPPIGVEISSLPTQNQKIEPISMLVPLASLINQTYKMIVSPQLNSATSTSDTTAIESPEPSHVDTGLPNTDNTLSNVLSPWRKRGHGVGFCDFY